MDLIERLLGASPDSGNGTFELLLFALSIVLIFIRGAARRARNQPL